MPWLLGELPCALLTEGFVLLSLTPNARGNVLPLAERGGRCEEKVTWGHSAERMPFGEWGKLGRSPKLSSKQGEMHLNSTSEKTGPVSLHALCWVRGKLCQEEKCHTLPLKHLGSVRFLTTFLVLIKAVLI